MKISRNVESAGDDVEVILFCLAKGQAVACMARRHWFLDEADKTGNTRRLGWQSTWDGVELPNWWVPYAFGTVEPPDPAGDLAPSPARPAAVVEDVL